MCGVFHWFQIIRSFQEWMAVKDLLDAWPHLIHSTITFNVHGISEPFNP